MKKKTSRMVRAIRVIAPSEAEVERERDRVRGDRDGKRTGVVVELHF